MGARKGNEETGVPDSWPLIRGIDFSEHRSQHAVEGVARGGVESQGDDNV